MLGFRNPCVPRRGPLSQKPRAKPRGVIRLYVAQKEPHPNHIKDRLHTALSTLVASALQAGCVPDVQGTASGTDTGGASTGTTEGTIGPTPQCEPFAPYVIDVQAEPNGLF